MFPHGSGETREKTFVTYFQGANKDSLNSTRQTSNFLNFKRKNRGWGSPVSIILGKSSTSSGLSNNASPVGSQDVNSAPYNNSPTNKSSWISALWDSKSKKTSNTSHLDSLSTEIARRTDLLVPSNDSTAANMSEAMVSGFAALMSDTAQGHDPPSASRTSSSSSNRRCCKSDEASTIDRIILSPSPVLSTDHGSRNPSQKVIDEGSDVVLAEAHRGERLQKRVDRISAVQQTLSSLSRSLSTLNESAILKSSHDHPSTITPVVTGRRINAPQGQTLRLDIFSTWGDDFFVGLTGLEVFDDCGRLVSVKDRISDVRQLHPRPSESRSPAWNLVDCTNLTCDDRHMWLTPIDQSRKYDDMGAIAVLEIEFVSIVQLSLVRVFNFNKSRTHSFRGARRCCLSLDNAIIFQGELKQAPGWLDKQESLSQELVFTDCDDVLKKIQDYTKVEITAGKDDATECTVGGEKTITRPLTSGEELPLALLPRNKSSDAFLDALNQDYSAPTPVLPVYNKSTRDSAMRPSASVTRLGAVGEHRAGVSDTISSTQPLATLQSSKHTVSGTRLSTEDFLRSLQMETAALSNATIKPSLTSLPTEIDPKAHSIDLFSCQRVRIELLSTWGDESFIGLTGIQLLRGVDLTPVSLSVAAVCTNPSDLSSVGLYGDPRVAANLVSDANNTTDERSMWLAPYTCGSQHEVGLTLDKNLPLAGARIWNYNKRCPAGEEALKGARSIKIFLDDKLLGVWELRIAPGVDGVEFDQTILFQSVASPSLSRCPGISIANRSDDIATTVVEGLSNDFLRQDYEPQVLPTGQLWTIVIHENWNDPYYVGLDSIEFLDAHDRVLDVLACGGSIQALPYSVAVLAEDSNCALASDPRVPRALLSGTRACTLDRPRSGCHCWLAPLTRRMTDAEKKRSSGPQFRVNQKTTHSSHFPEDNSLFVMFPYPVAVSCVRFRNYSKTPARGVKEMSLYVDGRLVYMGSLKQAVKGNAPQSIVFSRDLQIIKSNSSTMNYCGAVEQDVLCVNDNQIMVRARSLFERPNAASEGVVADLDKRPVTAFIA